MRRMMGKRRYQHLFQTLHDMALLGMNYRSGDLFTSGELVALEEIVGALGSRDAVTVFDVGANVGHYSVAASDALRGRLHRIHAFEPAQETFAALVERVRDRSEIVPVNTGLGERAGTAVLLSVAPGSGMATLHDRKRDLPPTHQQSVEISTLDAYCVAHRVTSIDLLKLDVEGHEMAVLLGAKELLASGRIDRVQFEFGEAAIDARHYLRDFFDLLVGFDFFRILQDGLHPLGAYRQEDEIFRTVNFLAVRRGAARG